MKYLKTEKTEHELSDLLFVAIFAFKGLSPNKL
jgi:hypothetical protein